MSTLAWLLILLVSAAAAFLAGRFTAPGTGQLKEMERQRDDAQAELRSYRENVNTHFEKTARLFNEVTVGYRTLYEHLADGSERLGRGPDSPLLSKRPEQRQLQEKLDGGAETDRSPMDTEPAQTTTTEAGPDQVAVEGEPADTAVEAGPERAATDTEADRVAKEVELERIATQAELEEARVKKGQVPESKPGEQKVQPEPRESGENVSTPDRIPEQKQQEAARRHE